MGRYGYVKPGEEAYVNWAKIGTDIAGEFIKGEAEREATRKQIDADTDKVLKAISDAPQGQHRGINQFSLDYSADAKKYMLMINKELKAGRLSPDDFIKYRQNASDGTGAMYGLLKSAQTKFAEIQKRKDDGVSSDIESQLAAQVQRLGRFTNSKAFISPDDGTVYVTDVSEGVANINPENLYTPNTLAGMLDVRVDKYDITANAKRFTESLGKDVKVIGKKKIETLSDITQRANLSDITDPGERAYFKSEEIAVNSMTSNPMSAASILIDSKFSDGQGNAYMVTYKKDDQSITDGYGIYMEYDPESGQFNPKLTDEQLEAARKAARSTIRMQLDREEKALPTFAPQPVNRELNYAIGQANQKEEEISNYAGYLWYGDDEQFKTAAAYFGAMTSQQGREINSISRDSTGVHIVYDDGKTYDLTSTSSGEDFVGMTGNVLAGIPNVKKSHRASSTKGKTWNPSEVTWETGGTIKPKELNEQQAVDADLSEKVNSSEISLPNTGKEAARLLDPIIQGYGFNVKMDKDLSDNNAIIIYPTGGKPEDGIVIDVSTDNGDNAPALDANAQDNVFERIRSYVSDNMTDGYRGKVSQRYKDRNINTSQYNTK